MPHRPTWNPSPTAAAITPPAAMICAVPPRSAESLLDGPSLRHVPDDQHVAGGVQDGRVGGRSEAVTTETAMPHDQHACSGRRRQQGCRDRAVLEEPAAPLEA